jgi:hypothetical protein
MSLIERKLAEKCASFGLPPNFDTLMRHMENNHAATVGAQRSHIESLERQLAGAVEALRRLAEIHHGTLTPSRLHDPENRDWTECECKSCRLAQPFRGQ